MTKAILVAATFLAALPASLGLAQAAASDGSTAGTSKPICKYVLATEPHAKPYELCQSRAQWDALEESYAKNANRMVCHYEEMPGTKLGAHKVCGPQSAWEARAAEARQMTEKIQMGTCVPGAGC